MPSTLKNISLTGQRALYYGRMNIDRISQLSTGFWSDFPIYGRQKSTASKTWTHRDHINVWLLGCGSLLTCSRGQVIFHNVEVLLVHKSTYIIKIFHFPIYSLSPFRRYTNTCTCTTSHMLQYRQVYIQYLLNFFDNQCDMNFTPPIQYGTATNKHKIIGKFSHQQAFSCTLHNDLMTL